MASLDDDSAPLPLPPLVSRTPDAGAHPALPRGARLRHALLANLPLFVMAVLALLTWWLVQRTPKPVSVAGQAAVHHEPDYQMTGFSVQHYTEVGPARGVIEGDTVRHFPDNDRLEIDGARLRWIDAQGHHLSAVAAHAVTSGDAQEVRLSGGARVVREPVAGESDPMEFSSESMVFDRRADQVRSNRPVTLRQGRSVVEARALVYAHADARLELQGPVHGSLSLRR